MTHDMMTHFESVWMNWGAVINSNERIQNGGRGAVYSVYPV